MRATAGIDVGSTYTKVVLVDEELRVLGRAMRPTGFALEKAARAALDEALAAAGARREEVAYVIATGIGRHQVEFKDVPVTDLTASGRGARHLFPGTRTVLDVGGQTMKVSRLDDAGKVVSFRLNDKCAAGTGAFIEKTARYLGYAVGEIGPLVATSRAAVPISGVCAVFAESEVINHLSLGAPPADILQGAVESLISRSVQLIKRAGGQAEFTLIGGTLRFDTMARSLRAQLKIEVNVPDPAMVQFVPALGAAILAQRRLKKLTAAAL